MRKDGLLIDVYMLYILDNPLLHRELRCFVDGFNGAEYAIVIVRDFVERRGIAAFDAS